ncbi:MAG: DctP family TRAP transporter solute-binding subunit [Deltaproteobacteria bacterium]|nr:DctP family TRAP transporter solute-binding subunit [Deltaproteobacteria bacterium]
MLKLKRSQVVLVIFAFAMGLAANCIAADQKVIKFAHGENDIDIIQSPYLAYTNVFKSIVESQTEGRYKVEVYPNKQLGDYRSQAEQVGKGVIEISGGQNAGQMASWAPAWTVTEIPYTVRNTEIGRMIYNGQFGKDLSEEIAAKANFRILSYLPSAFRSFMNNKRPIRTPADMKGLKIRTMEIAIHMEMVKALGASATPIAWSELYSALQTGVVDGQENAPYTVLLAKLQEVQKYYTLDNHLLNLALIIINDKFYKSLTPQDQRVFDYAARQAELAFLGIVTAKEAQDLEVIAKAGVQIYAPTPAEYAEFQKATKEPVLKVVKQKVDEKWINKFFDAVKEAEKKSGLSSN